MINSISGVTPQSQIEQTQDSQLQNTKTKNQNSMPQDTVTISNAAKQAAGTAKVTGGDIDHDGDSH